MEVLQRLILDFQESDIAKSTKRNIEVTPVGGKATICVGVRRGGKSTYMLQRIEKLLDSGVSIKNIVYIDFFDDRLHPLHQGDLDVVVDVYYAMYPDKKGNEKVYFFFDEIQMCQNWEQFVNRLMRTEDCAVYITGSSAKMLSKEIATQMRGRALSWEIFPFSFREFLTHNAIENTPPFSSKKQAFIRNGFERFWQCGGFPEVADVDDEVRVRIHQEYFHSVLFRDLIERYDIAHPKALADLAYWLIDNTASLYTVNRLTAYLKSLGHKVPKHAVSQYIEWFEDAYFFFTVRIFDASLARSNTNPKKIYCIDHSLVQSLSSGVLFNSGHQLENLVFTALRRKHKNIYYYKTRNGKEVDFIVQGAKRNFTLIQVSESLAEEKTRTREIAALTEAMQEKQLSSALLITRNEKETITLDNKSVIEVVPIWEFLLNWK